jgi:hypothetical protein
MKNPFRAAPSAVLRAALYAALALSLPSPFLSAQTPAIPELVKIKEDIPDFVVSLPSRNDTLYGYGAAIGADSDESAAIAENHARKDLAGRMIEGIPSVSDYIGKISKGAWDPAFVHILLLADRHLMDALTYTSVTAVEKRVQTPNGAVWYLVSVKKRDALAIITNVERLLQ